MSTDSTATMRAVDETGDMASSSLTLPYRFPHRPSEAQSGAENFARHRDQPRDADRTFKTYVVNTYKAERLGSRTWDCRSCQKPATTLYHSSTSILLPRESALVDNLVATCSSSLCTRQASEMAQYLGQTAVQTSRPTHCQNCGNSSNLNLCGACSFLGWHQLCHI